MEIANLTLTPRRGLIAGSWVLLGALSAGLLALSTHVEQGSVPWLALVAWFLVWLLWIPTALLLARAVERRPLGRSSWRRRLLPYLLGGMLLTAAMLTLRLTLDLALHLLTGLAGHGFVVNAFLVESVLYDSLVYLGLLALFHALDYHARYSRRLVQSAELEAQIAKVKLAFLRNQMQPHFLLNTLNLISALTHTDPERADAMIADLGDLLRVTMEDPESQEVPLDRELEYLERYLDIARVRFGSSLNVERHIDPALEQAMVPSLVLQPLVENAIRHGLAERNGQSRITIAARRSNGRVRLEVSDNGPGLPLAVPGPLHVGVGIGNTRRRLEELYGEAHRFEIRNRPEGGAMATLELPYRPAGDNTSETAEPELWYGHPYGDRRRRAASTREDQVVS